MSSSSHTKAGNNQALSYFTDMLHLYTTLMQPQLLITHDQEP